MLRTIRGLRNDLGMTQKEMADKLDVPIASYQRYETYSAEKIPFEVILKLADLTGLQDLRQIKYKRDM